VKRRTTTAALFAAVAVSAVLMTACGSSNNANTGTTSADTSSSSSSSSSSSESSQSESSTPSTSADSSSSESSAAASKPTGVAIGLVMLQGDKYSQSIQQSIDAAAKADGNTIIPVTSNGDAGTEASQVQTLIQRGVKAIVMQPTDPAAGSVATMKSVGAAGIPLICYGNCTDQALKPEIVKGVVQSDNTALGTATGQVAAEYIKSKLGGKAVIGILNCDIASACKLRKAGFKKALADAGVTVTYAADQSGYLVDAATPVATNILSGNPNINLVWAANEGGTGAWVAAEANSGKKVPIFGTDISDQLAKDLLDANDLLQATTGQDSANTAKKAYEMALNSIQGTANNPFEVQLPGLTYDRSKPADVQAYLSGS